jgi:hypothetical protein
VNLPKLDTFRTITLDTPLQPCYQQHINAIRGDAMKIEVGKKYELNNGDIVECTGKDSDWGVKYGYGPFLLGGMYYHEDGRFGCAGLNHSGSVKREHIEGKTLQELGVKAGDVVRWKDNATTYMIKMNNDGEYCTGDDMATLDDQSPHWSIVSRATQSPTLWRDMTDAEKGALLLAKFEGRDVDVWSDGLWCKTTPLFLDTYAYRIKPTPKVEQHAMRLVGNDTGNIYYGTINLVDGTPDPASIKMAAV